jgi:hypothetical protein
MVRRVAGRRAWSAVVRKPNRNRNTRRAYAHACSTFFAWVRAGAKGTRRFVEFDEIAKIAI